MATTPPGNGDAFVAKLVWNGSTLALGYSTFLGGSAGDERTNGIAVDSSGNAYITGFTSSSNFPATSGAYQTTLAGGLDAFIAKLNPTGSALVYATYLGGSYDEDIAYGIAVDATGDLCGGFSGHIWCPAAEQGAGHLQLAVFAMFGCLHRQAESVRQRARL